MKIVLGQPVHTDHTKTVGADTNRRLKLVKEGSEGVMR